MKRLLLLLLLAACGLHFFALAALGAANDVEINFQRSTTGTSFKRYTLSAPLADVILFYDKSAEEFRYLTLGTNISITGTTLNATGGGGEGTVTSFSAGDLSPLFTTTEATATTTPALSFALSSAAQNAVFAGPSAGGAGAPSYRALVDADIPDSITVALAGISDASANGRSLVGAANYAAMRTLLDLEAGTDFLALPTGTPDGTKFLRDDNTWQVPPGGSDDQTAAEVPFTPNGTIAATDVQAAIQEVRDEALATNGDGSGLSGVMLSLDPSFSGTLGGDEIAVDRVRTIVRDAGTVADQGTLALAVGDVGGQVKFTSASDEMSITLPATPPDGGTIFVIGTNTLDSANLVIGIPNGLIRSGLDTDTVSSSTSLTIPASSGGMFHIAFRANASGWSAYACDGDIYWRPDQLTIAIDGGGSVVTTGAKGFAEIKSACRITGVRVYAQPSGSAVVDLWSDSFANFPATDADSITASDPPTISAAVTSSDSDVSTWTTDLVAGEHIRANVDSASTVEYLLVVLDVLK